MGELFDTLERVEDALNRGDWNAWSEFHAEDVEALSPTYHVKGRDALIDVGKAQDGPFEEVRRQQWLIAETENTVVTEWTWSVPHPDVGEKWVTLRGLSYVVFDGGRVTKIRHYFDMAGFLAEFNPQGASAEE